MRKLLLGTLLSLILAGAPVVAQGRGLGDIYAEEYAAVLVMRETSGQDPQARETIQALADEGVALIDSTDIPACGADAVYALRTALVLLDRGVDLLVVYEDAVLRADTAVIDETKLEMSYVISSGVYLMDTIPYLTADVEC